MRRLDSIPEQSEFQIVVSPQQQRIDHQPSIGKTSVKVQFLQHRRDSPQLGIDPPHLFVSLRRRSIPLHQPFVMPPLDHIPLPVPHLFQTRTIKKIDDPGRSSRQRQTDLDAHLGRRRFAVERHSVARFPLRLHNGVPAPVPSL